jgi:hypothetical protein
MPQTMNRGDARDQLTSLGFSAQDAESMVTTNHIDRAVGGQVASGLTTDAEVLVFYRSGRYRIETRRRPPGPAPCMWRDDYEAAGERFSRASARMPDAAAEAARIIREAEDEYDAAEAWLRLHEAAPGIPLPQCRRPDGKF